MPQITDYYSLGEDKYVAIFKGEPGTAKTPAAASFPGVYIFDFERRIKSVVNYWLRRNKKDIWYDTFNKLQFKEFDEKLDSLISYCPYDTIVFDTLTSGSDLILGHIRRLKGMTKDKGKKVAGISVNSIEDYNAEASALDDIVSATRTMSAKHVILIAHVIQTETKQNLGENAKSIITRQLMSGGKKVAAKLPGYFDEAYHFQASMDYQDGQSKARYKAYTQTTGEDWAKTCLDLPYEMDFTDQNFYQILKPYMDNHPVSIKEGDDNVIS